LEVDKDHAEGLAPWECGAGRTLTLEAKAITFLAGFVALQAKAKEIELDAGHDRRGF
jgi:hypothetical protein